jgi:hypothetical protein
MRWRRQKEEQVEPTAVDAAAQRMATAVKHIRSLDSEVVSAFEEWRQAQAECSAEGITVELGMSAHFTAAFRAWHDHKNGGDAVTTVIPMERRDA